MVAVMDVRPLQKLKVLGRADGQDELLTPAALEFLSVLHQAFEADRSRRLAARRERQAFFDAGGLPDFRSDTASIRHGHWRVAPLPEALLDRQVEITGPVDPKMVINALNSGAKVYMADFEDSTTPTWANLLAGQRALRGAVEGTLTWTAPETGKHYALRPADEQAVLMVRPRGWHLDEKHIEVEGAPMSASLFDAGLFAFHNARTLADRDRGPYFYLPKLQCMEEAQLWNDVFEFTERALDLASGSIRVTVLIETLPAAFEMDEILHALRGRIVGLNCGRWDYVFSYIKTLRAHRDRLLPERGQVTMTQPFLRAYCDLLIQTCHRRGAHAMGGMAAQIPVSGDVDATEAAFAKVRADKLREVTAGCDGTWVAHPALVAVAQAVFDERLRGPNQHDVLREDVHVIAEDLLAPPLGTITRAGFEGNVEVCVRYLAAWLEGLGCVPIHGLMEDAATAEIARAQLWQWLHGNVHLDDGTPVDFALLERALFNLPSRLAAIPNLPGRSRVSEAIGMLDRMTHADTLEEFLTVPAYRRLE